MVNITNVVARVQSSNGLRGTVGEQMTCRDEILETATRLMRRNGEDTFSLADLIAEMTSSGPSYQASTIRTHVTSRLCANVPDHHAVTYPDVEHVASGRYRLVGQARQTPESGNPDACRPR